MCWLLLFKRISIDAYVGKAGVLILASLISCVSYSISKLFSDGNVDRHADVLIHVAINLKLMILKVDFH